VHAYARVRASERKKSFIDNHEEGRGREAAVERSECVPGRGDILLERPAESHPNPLFKTSVCGYISLSGTQREGDKDRENSAFTFGYFTRQSSAKFHNQSRRASG